MAERSAACNPAISARRSNRELLAAHWVNTTKRRIVACQRRAGDRQSGRSDRSLSGNVTLRHVQALRPKSDCETRSDASRTPSRPAAVAAGGYPRGIRTTQTVRRGILDRICTRQASDVSGKLVGDWPYAEIEPRELHKLAVAGDWAAVRDYQVTGSNSYSKLVARYQQDLLALHATWGPMLAHLGR